MIWTAFEVAINIFQGFLLLMYVKQCFTYDKKHPIADLLLVCSCAGFLNYLLFSTYKPYVELILYIFPVLYTFIFSSEKKLSIVYWLSVLILIFTMIATITYPIFELFPTIMRYNSSFLLAKRFLCIITTNVLLFFILKMIIRLKRDCPLPSTSSYIAFILTLVFAFIVEESLYTLFLEIGSSIHLPFLLAYLGLTAFTIMVIFLFRIVSYDAERKNHFQTEITMLSMTKQHQQELAQMYKTLTERQHDYKHHLQMLEQLVSSSSPTAKEYLDTIVNDSNEEDLIVTGSPEVDAVLTAKRRTMYEKGIEFKFTPYPLAVLPISVSDFCAILGNLLDNAIEGIERIAIPSAKLQIHLTLSRSWNMFYIYCTNPCEPSTLIKKKGTFHTSKKKTESGLHGIGLHSIKSIAEHAEGRTEFQVDGNEFHAKVVLPFLEETTR